MLQEVGSKIIGVVLNKADIRLSDYYYYHYSYKNSYYGEGNGHSAQESSSVPIAPR